VQCELPNSLDKEIYEKKNCNSQIEINSLNENYEFKSSNMENISKSILSKRVTVTDKINELEKEDLSLFSNNEEIIVIPEDMFKKNLQDVNKKNLPLYEGHILCNNVKEGEEDMLKKKAPKFDPNKINTNLSSSAKSYKLDQINESLDKMNNENILRSLIKICDKIYSSNDKIDKHNTIGHIRRKGEEIRYECTIDEKLNYREYSLDENYINSSMKIQNIISNSIREQSLYFDGDNILTFSLKNSYLDILVDKSKFMSEKHCISALILCIGICLALTNYGVKIRISVFENKNNIWLLSNNFDEEKDIKGQLFRLKNALNHHKKRILSLPGDSLVKLKYLYENQIKDENSKYTQILISTLISPQVINEEVDWDEINQKIIIFGLKTDFEKDEFKNIEETYLNVHYHSKKERRSANVLQEFLNPSFIIQNSITDKDEEKKYNNLVNQLILNLKKEYKGDKNLIERLPNEKNYKIKEIKLPKNFILNDEFLSTIGNSQDKKYFAHNCPKTYNQSFEDFEKLFEHSFPNPESLKTLSNEDYSNKKTNSKLNEDIQRLFKNCFSDLLEKNIASGKTYCSSGGIISARAFVKNFIGGGFSNLNIFQKKV